MNKTRRLVALLVSALLIFQTPVFVQAADILDWEQVRSAVTMDELGGAFTLIEEASLTMWLPDSVEEYALSEEDVENGYVAFYSTADEEFACAVMRLIPDNVDIMEVDELSAVLPEYGIESFSTTQINGMDAIIYEDEEQLSTSVVLGNGTGTFYEIAFYPVSDEGSEAVVSLMIASIQPISVLNWSDYRPWLNERGIQGSFQEFDSIAMKMWIPDTLVPVELTDEDRQDGFLGYYESEDGAASVSVEYIIADISPEKAAGEPADETATEESADESAPEESVDEAPDESNTIRRTSDIITNSLFSRKAPVTDEQDTADTNSDIEAEKAALSEVTEEISSDLTDTSNSVLDEFTYKQLLEQMGATDIEDISVNGLFGMYYEQPQQDSATAAFITEMGNILEITFSPVSASEFSDMMMGMIASIQETIYLYWEDAEATIEEYDLEGRFVTFDEVAVKLWLPEFLAPDERLEEAREDGFIGLYSSVDGEDVFAVQYIDMQGMDLETYSNMVEELGGKDLYEVTVNDLYAVCYWLEENNTIALAFTTESGYVIEFSATPTDNDELMAYMNLIFTSIQPE